MGPVEVQTLREALGLTQPEFGEIFGVTPQSVSRWETGYYEIARPLLRLLAAPDPNNAEAFADRVRDALLSRGGLAALHELLGASLPKAPPPETFREWFDGVTAKIVEMPRLPEPHLTKFRKHYERIASTNGGKPSNPVRSFFADKDAIARVANAVCELDSTERAALVVFLRETADSIESIRDVETADKPAGGA